MITSLPDCISREASPWPCLNRPNGSRTVIAVEFADGGGRPHQGPFAKCGRVDAKRRRTRARTSEACRAFGTRPNRDDYQMTSPEPTLPPAADLATIRRSINDLIDLWTRMVGTADSSFRGDLDLRRATSIHAHAHHAVQLARALAAMDQAGVEVAMVPMIRAIFEMGIVSAWLLLTPGSGDSLVREGTKKRKTAQEQLIKLGQDAGPGYAQSLATLAELDAAPATFETQCRSLAGGDSLYLEYRILSAQCHAGLGIADAYFVEVVDSPIGIAFDPTSTLDPRDAHLGIAACLLYLAVNADATARSKARHVAQLRTIARRLGVGTEIIRADGTTLPPRPKI